MKDILTLLLYIKEFILCKVIREQHNEKKINKLYLLKLSNFI